MKLTLLLTAVPVLVLVAPCAAADDIVGQPVSLIVEPPALTLKSPRDVRQLVVTGKYADGSLRDLTPLCQFSLDVAIAEIHPGGLVRAKSVGKATLTVGAGGKTAKIPLTVAPALQMPKVSFRNDVLAALGAGGCNSGACHGTPSGKGGFKLSLRGFDPEADFLQLTRDVLGRRTSCQNPDASLMLQKALGKVPHEGGLRFHPDSVPAEMIRLWLADGMPDDGPGLANVLRLQIVPGPRLLQHPAQSQQLAVLAHFSDATVRDVTRLTVFTSSEDTIATVSSTGMVQFHEAGEVAILCRYLLTMQAVRLTYVRPADGFVWEAPPENNYIDKHVFAKLKLMSLQPSELCTDEDFIRRVYLDVCAILPTSPEVKAFLADPAKDKRAKLIDHLLERVEYVDFWTMHWADVLRISRKTLGDKGAKLYRDWLHTHLKQNTAFDQVVRELLTAKGNTFENGPANYYRVTNDPTELGESAAQLFLGVRMQCAKCHNHPFEKWTQDDYYSLSAFFARVGGSQSGKKNPKKLDADIISVLNAGDILHPKTNVPVAPAFLGGGLPKASDDRRELFADWLTAPQNPFFAKALVNRLWFHLFRRGIVEPVDDFRESNPSANDELLDALAKHLIETKFNVQHLLRTILNSRTYQLSARPNAFNKDDSKYYSRTFPKMLTAEQLLDAICSATDVPEIFKGYPPGTRAVELIDDDNHPFLKAFGQPNRTLPCECERDTDASVTRALQLINGATITKKLTTPNNRIGKLIAAQAADGVICEELYLATMSRLPTPAEMKVVLDYVVMQPNRRQAWEDVHWAMLNSKEFMFRH